LKRSLLVRKSAAPSLRRALSYFTLLVLVAAPRAAFAAEGSKPTSTGKTSVADKTAKAAKSDSAKEVSGDYVLQPLDLLQFEVYDEKELKLDVRISQEYSITLPLIGSVELKDVTLRAASELIRKRYADKYIRNPQITLLVKEYASRTVSVLGSVNKPGSVKFQPEQNLTLVEAIAEAGGFTRLGDRSKVKLTRNNPDGSSSTQVIDVDALLTGKDATEWRLQTRDVIFVPERIL
jgi:polysaccharide export outer membrane protein